MGLFRCAACRQAIKRGLAFGAVVGLWGALSALLSLYLVSRPGNRPTAERFVQEALEEAIAFLGQPALPIRQVHLRLPIDPSRPLEEDSPFTALLGADKGIFAISLSRHPHEDAFYGQLAHEVAHLLNPWLSDCYVEGLSTLFAERFLKKQGLDWSYWERYFREGKDPFYAATYVMMKEVAAAGGEEPLKTLLSFARWTDKAKGRVHLDITAWLASLPEDQRERVRAVILKHAETVRHVSALHDDHPECVLPQ